VEDRLKEALRVKEAGTQLFRKGLFSRSLEKYESANGTLHPSSDDPVNFRPVVVQLLGNISLCHIKMESWHEAASVCGKALEINPADVKALYRRAIARR
jgi:tetratricopeptide (TPR) repeat protein